MRKLVHINSRLLVEWTLVHYTLLTNIDVFESCKIVKARSGRALYMALLSITVVGKDFVDDASGKFKILYLNQVKFLN